MKIIRLEDAKEWPEYGPLTPEQLKEAYALFSASLTPEDLKGFNKLDEGEPLDEFLAELEKLQKEHDQKPS